MQFGMSQSSGDMIYRFCIQTDNDKLFHFQVTQYIIHYTVIFLALFIPREPPSLMSLNCYNSYSVVSMTLLLQGIFVITSWSEHQKI